MQHIDRIRILHHPFDTLKQQEFYSQVRDHLVSGNKLLTISFANPEHIQTFNNYPDIQEYTESCTWVVPDGAGVVWASRVLNTPLPERITGTDFAYEIASACEMLGKRLCVYGGTEQSNRLAIHRYKELYPTLVCMGAPGWNIQQKEVVTQIQSFDPHVIMVCLYNGMQERWIMKHATVFPHCLLMFGNGGAVDFVSGLRKRAPKWIQKLALEWLWRLPQDLRWKKIKQVFTIPTFMLRVLYARFSIIKP